MKPAFALSFSTTGISLHHRSDDDWFCIGEVALDASDLNDQIEALRDKGFALENNLSCKVVLPSDQVRYHSVDGDDSAAGEQAKHALTKATPYTLEELVFDVATRDGTTFVAAVTRQTLDEAREFATQHGFIPVEITAEPDAQEFPSEPQFFVPAEAPLQVEFAGALPAVVEDPAPKPDGPAVHAIADTTAPDVFRSAPTTESSATPADAASVLGKRYTLPAAAAALVAVAVGVWAAFGTGGDETSEFDTAQTENTLSVPEPDAAEPDLSATPEEPDVAEVEETPPEGIEPSATDAAILEALNIAPTVVEDIASDPEPEQIPAQPEVSIIEPAPLQPPALEQPEEQYLASVDSSNLSNDAIALPPVQSFDTDTPLALISLPGAAETQTELDANGLVAPTPDGTVNPDGIPVYLGQPSKVPPEAPLRFEEEPTPENTPDRLAGLRPKLRPGDLLQRFERQQYGGRSRAELAILRPKVRPASLQVEPEPEEPPVVLASAPVPRPKTRPAGLKPSSGTQTASLGSAAGIGQVEVDTFKPKVVAPKIPSSASVARQATIDNALNLRKLNLIGVYGTPADRRALVRLPSGRYKKLKVGDRLDGGSVIAIGDNELRYQKRGKNVTLKMPRS
ncbi:hypothetical protein [Ruegeria sp.]|uniref:hypothetical protein n=1 Tax=Ruegeria sp. TaxID=1879320 RepID=UPI003B58B65C